MVHSVFYYLFYGCTSVLLGIVVLIFFPSSLKLPFACLPFLEALYTLLQAQQMRKRNYTEMPPSTGSIGSHLTISGFQMAIGISNFSRIAPPVSYYLFVFYCLTALWHAVNALYLHLLDHRKGRELLKKFPYKGIRDQASEYDPPAEEVSS